MNALTCERFRWGFGLLCLASLGSSIIDYPFPFRPKAKDNITAVVLVADGTEELEAVSIVELLRRAGIIVTIAGAAGPGPVTCKYACVLSPDTSVQDVLQQEVHDLVVIPGGEEAANFMAQSEEVGQLLLNHQNEDRYLGAIGSGPLVLDAHKIRQLCRLTSAPEYKEKLRKHYSYYNYDDTIVDLSARVITGRHSAMVFEFALSLINHVADFKAADKVAHEMLPTIQE